MKNIIWIFLFLFILGPVPNTPLGIFFDIILLTSVGLILLNRDTGYIAQHYYVKKISYVTFLPFFYIIIIGFPLALVTKSGDSSFLIALVRPIKILITFFGALALVKFFRKYYPDNFFELIVNGILHILLFNSIIMILQLFLPEFRDFISLILFDNVSDIHYQSLMRMGGFYLSGGALASVFQAISLLLLPYLFKKKQINIYQLVIYFPIIIFSIIITGRSGLFIIPFSFLIFFKFSKSSFRLLLIALVFLPFIFYSNILSSIENLISTTNNIFYEFNLNRLLDLSDEIGLSSNSTIKYLFSSFTLPENLVQLMLGDLSFSNYIFTDVSDMGYNLSIYKYGIFGSFFYYSPYLLIIYFLYKSEIENKENHYFTKILVLVYVFYEFKEEFLYARNGLSIIFLIVIALFINVNHKNIIQNKK